MKRGVGWGSLGMKDYAICVIFALEMNSIISFCCELLKDIRTKYMPNYFIICPYETKMNTMLKIGNTSSYSPVIVPPKNCKTSVVLNVHCSNISTIWDIIYL